MATRSQDEHRRTRPGQYEGNAQGSSTHSFLSTTPRYTPIQIPPLRDPAASWAPCSPKPLRIPSPGPPALPSLRPGTSQREHREREWQGEISQVPMRSGTPTSLLPTPPPGAASPPLTTSGAGRQQNWGGSTGRASQIHENSVLL